MTIDERALDFVSDGQIVGLGSGRAATAFLRTLAGAVGRGLRIRAVPTSVAVAAEARRLGLPLASLDDTETIDVTVDGADEVDPDLDLIKGYGGALVRERVVAAASRQFVILVGPEKLVPVLGTRGRLPIEVVPFSLPFCLRRLRRLGFDATPRMSGDHVLVTDNGNHQIDCAVGPITDPRRLEEDLLAVAGVIDTGLFLGMADSVLVQAGNQVEVRQRRRAIVEPPGTDVSRTNR